MKSFTLPPELPHRNPGRNLERTSGLASGREPGSALRVSRRERTGGQSAGEIEQFAPFQLGAERAGA